TGLAQESGQGILEAMQEGSISYITFTSSSTVENFFSLVQPSEVARHQNQGLRLVCIGPVTAGTLNGFGLEADIVPEDYTIPGLVNVLLEDAGKRGDNP
ncbi:uroporphyrinogen-III synthase, partial [Desulfonatronospira sp.]|uniref:uroporphyrinogen-III synthase n=1 Tax=Desulfonatronospira sp. TaxID=1962951 RepID=UPI0025B92E30